LAQKDHETFAAGAGSGSLYLATRHFAGWYMVNVLELPSEDVAIALGHTDGGELVRKLYGHRDRERALDRVTSAYERTTVNMQLGRSSHRNSPLRSPACLRLAEELPPRHRCGRGACG
jgi:hypothetical protein